MHRGRISENQGPSCPNRLQGARRESGNLSNSNSRDREGPADANAIGPPCERDRVEPGDEPVEKRQTARVGRVEKEGSAHEGREVRTPYERPLLEADEPLSEPTKVVGGHGRRFGGQIVRNAEQRELASRGNRFSRLDADVDGLAESDAGFEVALAGLGGVGEDDEIVHVVIHVETERAQVVSAVGEAERKPVPNEVAFVRCIFVCKSRNTF